MSCRWYFHFSATGPIKSIGALKPELSQLRFQGGGLLFHEVEIEEETGTFFVVHASRNYGGLDPLTELIARFPDLSFHGSAYCEGAIECYFIYEGRVGEISVTEYVIPDFDFRDLERDEIEREIEKLEAKISRLEARRLELQGTLLRQT